MFLPILAFGRPPCTGDSVFVRYRRYTLDPFCVFASFWASGACCAPEMHLKCTCKASPGCRSPTCKALPNAPACRCPTCKALPNVQSLTCLPLPNLQSLTCLQKPHQPAKPHLDFTGLRFRYKVICFFVVLLLLAIGRPACTSDSVSCATAGTPWTHFAFLLVSGPAAPAAPAVHLEYT